MNNELGVLNSNSTSKNIDNSNYIRDSINENEYQRDYMEKIKKMENLIGIIKNNDMKQKRELEERLRYKNELENNVELLSSYIKRIDIKKKILIVC